MQPKRVLHRYLADLMAESDAGDAIEERALAQSLAVDTAVVAEERQTSQSTLGIDDGEKSSSVAGRIAQGLLAENDSLVATASPSIPDWAAEPFQILVFRICDVSLAVPLSELNSIARWNGKLTPIPGQPAWQLGLFLHKQRKISLVDLPSVIMPERAVNGIEALHGYLLLVGGARWGLPCNSIQRPLLVRADNIRWNKSRERRPWSHGIIVENLSVLLNIDALLMMLGTNDA